MAEVAGQMTSAVDQWVPSWVERVSGDSGAVLAETGRGWLSRSEVELIRHVVVAARLGGVTATRHLLDEAELSLQGDQHGLAATSKLGVTGEIPERPPGLMWLQFVRLRAVFRRSAMPWWRAVWSKRIHAAPGSIRSTC